MLAIAADNQSVPVCFSVNTPPFQYNHTIASAYFSSTFTVLGVTSNLLALAVLWRAYRQTHSRSRSSFLVLLSGLALTDLAGLLVTGSVVLSFHLTRFDWHQLDPRCHFCTFMGASMVFYGLCPLLLGAAMAVERFVGIARPFARRPGASKSRAAATVLGVWLAAGIISLLPVAGLGSYHVQLPGSWCFINMGPRPLDVTFCLIFSLVGLLSLGSSFLLNTLSVVTLLRICCGKEAARRPRNHEVEMMVQLVWIMVIASICWSPMLVTVQRGSLSGQAVSPELLLFCLRFACFNQICDPWVYIICQLSLRCRPRRPQAPSFLSHLETAKRQQSCDRDVCYHLRLCTPACVPVPPPPSPAD